METISAEEFKKRYGEVAAQKLAQPPQPQGGMGQDISNAFQGGIDQMKQGYQDASNTNNVFGKLKAGVKELAGGVNTLAAPLAPATKYIGQGVNAAADQISNIPVVQQFAQTPAGQTTANLADFLTDTSTVLGATGGVKGVSKAGIVAADSTNKGLGIAGSALKGAGEAAYGLTIAPEKNTAKALLNYDAKQPDLMGRIKNFTDGQSVGEKPITEANTAARHGLAGTEYGLGVKAKKITDSLWKDTIQPKLQAVKGKTDMKQFLGEIEKEIQSSGGDLTRRKALTEALSSIKEDYKNVSGITLEKLQDYKKGWAEFIPDAAYNGKPIAASLKKVHDLMAAKARKVIYKNIGNEGKQAYIDYGNLQSIIDSAIKSTTGDPASKSLSRDVWQFVMNKAVTPIATYGGKVLYKTGEGLEFLGKKDAKTVEDAIK